MAAKKTLTDISDPMGNPFIDPVMPPPKSDPWIKTEEETKELYDDLRNYVEARNQGRGHAYLADFCAKWHKKRDPTTILWPDRNVPLTTEDRVTLGKFIFERNRAIANCLYWKVYGSSARKAKKNSTNASVTVKYKVMGDKQKRTRAPQKQAIFWKLYNDTHIRPEYIKRSMVKEEELGRRMTTSERDSLNWLVRKELFQNLSGDMERHVTEDYTRELAAYKAQKAKVKGGVAAVIHTARELVERKSNIALLPEEVPGIHRAWEDRTGWIAVTLIGGKNSEGVIETSLVQIAEDGQGRLFSQVYPAECAEIKRMFAQHVVDVLAHRERLENTTKKESQVASPILGVDSAEKIRIDDDELPTSAVPEKDVSEQPLHIALGKLLPFADIEGSAEESVPGSMQIDMAMLATELRPEPPMPQLSADRLPSTGVDLRTTSVDSDHDVDMQPTTSVDQGTTFDFDLAAFDFFLANGQVSPAIPTLTAGDSTLAIRDSFSSGSFVPPSDSVTSFDPDGQTRLWDNRSVQSLFSSAVAQPSSQTLTVVPDLPPVTNDIIGMSQPPASTETALNPVDHSPTSTDINIPSPQTACPSSSLPRPTSDSGLSSQPSILRTSAVVNSASCKRKSADDTTTASAEGRGKRAKVHTAQGEIEWNRMAVAKAKREAKEKEEGIQGKGQGSKTKVGGKRKKASKTKARV